MHDDSAAFSLTWAPETYPPYDPADDGSWRVMTDDGAPVAVVWTNGTTSSGITWLTQTDAVMRVRRHFFEAVAAGTAAYDAYLAVELLPGVELTPHEHGEMSEVTFVLESLMEEDSEPLA